MKNYDEIYQQWLDSPSLSEVEWAELNSISGDKKEIESRFFAPLEFGTAGLRGIMGMGINRMNIHVVRHVTQAFANVIRAEGEDAMNRGIVICYDCRIGSEAFAHEAAGVMAANGVKVLLFDSLRPTPELSFAIRHYGATAGINVTASHNPKAYNGYKVYWSDGAQLPPDHADDIAAEMSKIDIFSDVERMECDTAIQDGLVKILGEETDEEFLRNVLAQSINPDAVKKAGEKLQIVYTPFHGAGYRLVPEALNRLGIKGLVPVPEQIIPDGEFPTVINPNPEMPEGYALAIELAKKIDSDLIIGTDPDADRVGVMVRFSDDEYRPITGNQMGVLLLDYIINAKREAGTLPSNAAAIKTIVTTEMAREVCDRNGVRIDDTFTGFKFMAEKIAEYQKDNSHEYILAYEESYGYMTGDFVRDKDAVTASLLIAEMAAHYYLKGMTLLDAMASLYKKYGCFSEKTMNLIMPGLDGLRDMQNLMADLRANPPSEISGTKVIKQRDYLSGKIWIPGIGMVGQTEICDSNVLYYELNDGTSFIVRPSGTEPKIKVYILTRGETMAECDEKIAKYEAFGNPLTKNSA